MSDAPATPDHPDLGDDRPAAPSRLETRYRRVLRLLPVQYRAVREQEMVDAFVSSRADADPEIADVVLETGWPGLRESASVVALALRLRWADPYGPRRYRVMTAALAYATSAALAVFAVLAASALLSIARVAWAPPPGIPGDLLVSIDRGGWSIIENWSYVLWIPALLLATLGGRRGTRWALSAAAVPVVVSALTMIPRRSALGVLDWAWLAAQVAVLAGLAGSIASGQQEDARHRPLRLLAAAGGFVAFEAIAIAASAAIPWLLHALRYAIVDTAGFWCAAAVLATLTLLARRVRRAGVTPGELLGLAFLAGTATVLRAAALPIVIGAWTVEPRHAGSTGMLFSAVVQFALVAMITIAAGALAGHRIRRLPQLSYLPAGPPRQAG